MAAQRELPIICVLSREAVADLARIEIESNKPPWSENLFASEFSNRYSTIFGARFFGRLAAFLVAHIVVDQAHIVNFAVASAARGRGIGKALLRHAIREMHQQGIGQVSLEVRVGNVAARGLYAQTGFSEVAVRKHYYSDNQEDAIVMSLDIPHFIEEYGGEEPEEQVFLAG